MIKIASLFLVGTRDWRQKSEVEFRRVHRITLCSKPALGEKKPWETTREGANEGGVLSLQGRQERTLFK